MSLLTVFPLKTVGGEYGVGGRAGYENTVEMAVAVRWGWRLDYECGGGSSSLVLKYSDIGDSVGIEGMVVVVENARVLKTRR